MPNAMFFAALIAAGAGYWALKERKADEKTTSVDISEEEDTLLPDQINLDEIAENAPVSIQLGFGLINLVSEDGSGALTTEDGRSPSSITRLGFVIPPVRIRDDLTLDGDTYRIRVGATIVGEDKIYPEKRLAIAGEDSRLKLEGINVKDPSF